MYFKKQVHEVIFTGIIKDIVELQKTQFETGTISELSKFDKTTQICNNNLLYTVIVF